MNCRLRLLILLLLLAGCGAPRLDTSSGGALEESLQEVRASLTPAQRAPFEQVISTRREAAKDDQREAFAALHGMSGEEVLQFASIEAANEEACSREVARQALLAELKGLVSRESIDSEYRAALLRIAIERPEVASVDQVNGSPKHQFSGVLTNSSTKAIVGVDVSIAVRSPGRTYAWESATCKIRVAGGVEPGESVEIASACPDGVPYWKELLASSGESSSLIAEIEREASGEQLAKLKQALDDRAGSVLTVSVLSAVGALDEAYAERLSPRDVKRLAQIRKEISAIEAEGVASAAR